MMVPHTRRRGHAGGFGDGLDYLLLELLGGAVAGFRGPDRGGVEALEDAVAMELLFNRDE